MAAIPIRDLVAIPSPIQESRMQALESAHVPQQRLLCTHNPLGKKAQVISVPKAKASGYLSPLYSPPPTLLLLEKSGFPLIQGQFQQNYKFSQDIFPSFQVVALKPPTFILRKGLGIILHLFVNSNFSIPFPKIKCISIKSLKDFEHQGAGQGEF